MMIRLLVPPLLQPLWLLLLARSAVLDKTFQPFDLSTTTTTTTYASKSPAGGMAAELGFPFTWAQWKELERQAMIYKYMTASIPVPPDLLLPIAQSFSTANPHPLGNNGYLKLGLSSSTGNGKEVAEPGRCKRTDGKKWRCSRDVAPHQKYCERHLNRGRPRSRKPVEVLVPVQPSLDNNNSSINNNKKTRFDGNHNLPSPSVLHSSRGLLGSNSTLQQPNGIPLFLDDTSDENLSDVSSYKELGRGFDWRRQELNLNPYTDFSNFSDEPQNLYPYTDFGAPEPEPDLISSQTHNRMESRRGFIDAWSENDSNTSLKKQPSSSLSSHSNTTSWPSSLTLSMAMAAGNTLDEEMGLGGSRCNADSEDLELHKANADASSWLSPGSYVGSAPGGPLAEMLRPNSLATCSDTSPSEVLQRSSFLSLSDSSGCTSPAMGGAVPEIMPFQWLN